MCYYYFYLVDSSLFLILNSLGIRRRGDEYAAGSFDDYMPPEKRAAAFVQPLVPAPMMAAGPTRLLVDLERRNAELITEV